MAYRSLPRPSSPRDAKASIVRPYTLGKKLLASRYVAILFDSRLAFQGSKNGAEVVGLTGVEPVTSSLSGTRSNQLSYKPTSIRKGYGTVDVCGEAASGLSLKFHHCLRRGCLLRKEVIQPLVPQRLPCYDFIPITTHTLGRQTPDFGCRRLS